MAHVPDYIRSARKDYPNVRLFPDHIRSLFCKLRKFVLFSGACPFTEIAFLCFFCCRLVIFPEHIRSIFHYLCTGKSKQNSANMAGTVKDMSLIKQVLQLKQLGESNRGIAKKLPINKETVNSYMSKVESNKWKIDELLQVDDLELERMFHAGSPAYTDVRKQDFLSMLPYIKEQLSDPKNHVTI